MKKIYFSSCVLLLCLFVKPLQAQFICSTTNPPVVRNYTYVVNGQQVCAVYVENMLPNSPVTLFGPNLTPISSASGASVHTDVTGFACFIYPCNQTPVRVTTCNANGCCYALVPAAASLPVRLTGFTGRIVNENSIRLDWTTAAELNSNKYIIEKSTDGKNFYAIGEIGAAGNSARQLSYQFTDKVAGSSNVFYRLKQVDIDEKFEYSKVVYVNVGKGNTTVTSVFPNPFKNEIQLVGISAAELNQKNVRLFNATGQQVSFRISGANAITINDQAKAGIYILKVNDQTFKLIKQ